jgi:hypothetical protein
MLDDARRARIENFHPRQSFPRQVACLSLTNGRTWGIFADDLQAHDVTSRLAELMKMGNCVDPACKIIVSTGEEDKQWDCLSDLEGGVVKCQVKPVHECSPEDLAVQFIRIASVIVLDAEQQGGALLHAALVERDGYGVILAGRGGIGKTTTSQRFPAPWRPLCDDTTLIVRDEQGIYRAHPWPTWSTFMFGGSGGIWDVQRSVSLKCIFFLAHAQKDRIVSIEPDQAIGALLRSAEQGTLLTLRKLGADGARSIRSRRFDNIWNLMQAVPCYILYLSRTGEFWHEIERVIDIDKSK